MKALVGLFLLLIILASIGVVSILLLLILVLAFVLIDNHSSFVTVFVVLLLPSLSYVNVLVCALLNFYVCEIKPLRLSPKEESAEQVPTVCRGAVQVLSRCGLGAEGVGCAPRC